MAIGICQKTKWDDGICPHCKSDQIGYRPIKNELGITLKIVWECGCCGRTRVVDVIR